MERSNGSSAASSMRISVAMDSRVSSSAPSLARAAARIERQPAPMLKLPMLRAAATARVAAVDASV